MLLHTQNGGCAVPDSGGTAKFNLRQQRVWSLDEVALVVDRLATEMVLRGYPRRDTFAVRLAVQEAVVNAIMHGHRGQTDKAIQISYLVVDEWVLVEVEDRGPGFDPKLVPDPLAEENLDKASGRGLLLMRHYMNWVRFFGRGNVVTMWRQRSET